MECVQYESFGHRVVCYIGIMFSFNRNVYNSLENTCLFPTGSVTCIVNLRSTDASQLVNLSKNYKNLQNGLTYN